MFESKIKQDMERAAIILDSLWYEIDQLQAEKTRDSKVYWKLQDKKSAIRKCMEELH